MSSEAPSADTPKPKRKKLLLIIVGAAVLLGGGAGGAWMYLQKQGHASAEHVEAPRKAPSKSIYTPLDNFTVNLRDPGGDHFAQIGITLEVDDATTENELKARLPALRNNILLLLSSKTVEELLTPEGKQVLAKQIGVRAAQSIGVNITDADLAPAAHGASAAGKARVENPIKDVLFSQFLVQ